MCGGGDRKNSAIGDEDGRSRVHDARGRRASLCLGDDTVDSTCYEAGRYTSVLGEGDRKKSQEEEKKGL